MNSPPKTTGKALSKRFPRICESCGCFASHRAFGLCDKHYDQTPARREYSREKDRKKSASGYFQRYWSENKRANIRRKANSVVNNAVASGTLARELCQICGDLAHAHHDSYEEDQWLSVRWLCTNHHAEWHKAHDPIYPILP